MADSFSYKKMSLRMGCSQTTFCKKKNVHYHIESDDKLNNNLDSIFVQAEKASFGLCVAAFNPIELMWAIIKRYVAIKNPANRSQLINFTIKAWDSLEYSVKRRAIERLKTKIPPDIRQMIGNLS